MAELKETPIENPRLHKLAQALRAARDFGNKAQIPEAIPLIGGQGVGDLFLGEAPEEVEDWGYGNYPMQIPEMTNVPQMKTGRGKRVADVIGAMPMPGMGGGTASQAMIAVGGDPRLILSRAQYADQLVNAMRKPDAYMKQGGLKGQGIPHPSFALQYEGVPEDFGDVLILPHPRAVDPAVNPQNELYNIDAYTGWPEAGRKDTRLLFDTAPDKEYALRISTSPKFNSFANFETSRSGARSVPHLAQRRQVTNDGAFERIVDELDRMDPEWYDNIQFRTKPLVELLRRKPELAPLVGDMRRASGFGQEHAELKVVGGFPISESTVSKIYLPDRSVHEPSYTKTLNEAKRLLDKRRVPWEEYEMSNGASLGDPEIIRDAMKTQAGAKMASSLRSHNRMREIDMNAWEQVAPIMQRLDIPGDDMGDDVEMFKSFIQNYGDKMTPQEKRTILQYIPTTER